LSPAFSSPKSSSHSDNFFFFSLGSRHRPAVLTRVKDASLVSAALRLARAAFGGPFAAKRRSVSLTRLPLGGARGGLPRSTRRNAESETPMLRIYDTMITTLALLRPIIDQVERSDRDLGNQLRRCAASVALNLAEVAPGKAWEEEA
jgi:hypothetical protein